MRKTVLMALTAVAAVSAGLLAIPRAEAMTIGSPAGLGVVADRVDATENVQYIYGGRNHCWYATGWRGPGWYWCGYRWRRGYGWGGPAGWQGWTYGGPPGVVVAPRYRHGPPVVGPGYRHAPPHGRVIVVPR